MESAFSARALGNWEVPSPRSSGVAQAGAATGSTAGSVRSVGRDASRAARGSAAANHASRMSSLVDSNGHLLPGKKKMDSSFRYGSTAHPVARTSGIFVTWNEFDNMQDTYAQRALGLFGGTGGSAGSIMSAERPRSVGSVRGNKPRSLRPLGRDAGRPRTPDAIFDSGRRTPVVQMDGSLGQIGRLVGTQKQKSRSSSAQTLVVHDAPSDDVVAARAAVWVGGVPASWGSRDCRR